MRLPTKRDRSSSPAVGGVMLLACLAGPVLAGALAGLGSGVLVGAGGVVFSLALCGFAPALVVAARRRAARRRPVREP